MIKLFRFHFIFFYLQLCYYVKAATIVCDNNALVRLGLDLRTLRYCHKNLAYKTRAWDLVQRMSLDEKIAQLGDRAPGVPRLNLPPYNWRSEALHGVSDVGVGTHFDNNIHAATNFPAVILTAASFNEDLWRRIGVAVSNEARALYNAGLAGLTFWSPNVNVATDPRWGRIQETAGEDPFVIGRYAVNYVRGLQDVEGQTTAPDPYSRSLKVAACCKYYTAYHLEQGTGKFNFNAQVPAREMVETFNYPFEMCVREGDAASVMCSYNKINGVPICADPKLLNETVRGSWGLHGYIVGACDWVISAISGSNITPAEAIAQAYKAGVDLDCRGDYIPKYVNEAINQKKLTVADIEKSLVNLYVVLMRLGWFDGRDDGYNKLGKIDVCSAQNLELAIDAARQGIVLLQNDQHILPLPLNISNKPTIALIGPHANATTAMLGNYALKTGKPCRYISPLAAISLHANVKYAPGCPDIECVNDTTQEAVRAMDGTYATLLFVGLDQSMGHEGSDVQTLRLPTQQAALIDGVLNAANSSFVIIVIMSATPIDISEWSDRASAIVWAGYPGADGGRAIADVLFGRMNPAGRLPITWYGKYYTDKVPMGLMQLRPKPELEYPGKTYKFYKGNEIIYPFGYGLSYTSFNYTSIWVEPVQVAVARPETPNCRQLNYTNKGPTPPCPAYPVKNCKCNEMVKIVVKVNNYGHRRGDHVVLLYSIPPPNIDDLLPWKRLVGFQRVLVMSKETIEVVFNLNVCKSFSFVTQDAVEVLPSGIHTIVAGNNLTSIVNGSSLLEEEETSLSTTFPIQFRVEKLRKI